MPVTKTTSRPRVAVIVGDPRLPYSFAESGWFGEEELEAIRRLREALEGLDGYDFLVLDDHDRLIDDLRTETIDLAVNFCDSGYRNDWLLTSHVASLLEMLGIPFTGPQGTLLDMAANKAVLRAVAITMAIPMPNETFVDLTAEPLTLPQTYPALIKPNAAGGSFGVTRDSVVHDAIEAEERLRRLAEQVQPPEALIQDYLTGREYTLGLIGNPDTGFTVLPVAEVDYSRLDPSLPRVFTYSAKFDPESPYWKQLDHRPAEVDEETHARLVTIATRVFRRFGMRDFARFDFREGADGQPRLLDANANPTWYWNARLAIMAEWAGHSYQDMIRLILDTATARCGLT